MCWIPQPLMSPSAAPGWQHGQVLTGCVGLGATYLPPAPMRLRVAPSIPWSWGESWVTAPGSTALLGGTVRRAALSFQQDLLQKG